MAQREGSVYLYLFIGTFVLFVGAVIAFFVENNAYNQKLAELDKEKKRTEEANQLRANISDELEKLRKLVDEQAGPAWPGNQVYMDKITDVKNFINDRGKKIDNRAPKVYSDLSSPLPDIMDIVRKLDDARQKAMDQMKLADKDKLDTLNSSKEDRTKLEGSIAQYKNQLTETESRYSKQVTDARAENERLIKDLALAKEQQTSAEIDWKRQRSLLENQILSLKTRLDRLLEEYTKVKSIEDVDPDGKILEVASTSQIGWIDIGRKQNLRAGMDFQVFQTIKGGKRQYKGRIEVQQVEDAVSRFRILETLDDLNPITKGDFITSPFFDPKAKPVFVIAGEGLDTKKITQEGLVAKIKGYGGEIRDKVDLQTTFLIALRGYESKPEYKEARELSIPILREKDILQFLGL